MKNQSEFCVPVTALALPGEAEGQSTPPTVGDSVDITGTAKVTRIEGDKAYLAPETINGAAVEMMGEQAEDLDADEKMMRDDAAKDEKAQVY